MSLFVIIEMHALVKCTNPIASVMFSKDRKFVPRFKSCKLVC